VLLNLVEMAGSFARPPTAKGLQQSDEERSCNAHFRVSRNSPFAPREANLIVGAEVSLRIQWNLPVTIDLIAERNPTGEAVRVTKGWD
jgi:hypothetical protein